MGQSINLWKITKTVLFYALVVVIVVSLLVWAAYGISWVM